MDKCIWLSINKFMDCLIFKYESLFFRMKVCLSNFAMIQILITIQNEKDILQCISTNARMVFGSVYHL